LAAHSFRAKEEDALRAGDFVYGSQERGFICLGWFVKAADLSHELERSSANLFVRNRRIKVEKSLDISAHWLVLLRAMLS
jgi:hypothetical protein